MSERERGEKEREGEKDGRYCIKKRGGIER